MADSQRRRSRTHDRGPPGAEELSPRLVAEQLGPKMSRLPNGSLFCEDVPVARVGWMAYGRGETPIAPAPGTLGMAYVERGADELFSAEALASLMGCAVTDSHPPDGDWVDPDNWPALSHGFATTNVRRGTGADSDVILADLVITRKKLIADVLSGKREVSAGYEADYELTGPGQGRQKNIRFNHIALVDKGRCGPRCAIGDRAPTTNHEDEDMTSTQRTALRTPRARLNGPDLDELRTRVSDAQAELAEAEEAGGGDADTHIHIHTADYSPGAAAPVVVPAVTQEGGDVAALAKTVGELAGTVTALAKTVDSLKTQAPPNPEGGEGGDGGGSAALQDSYKQLTAQCEILVPGFSTPTFDSAAPRKLTVDGMCKMRRRALELSFATKDGAAIISAITGAKTLDSDGMDCKETALLFNAACHAKATANNRAATGDSGSMARVIDDKAPARVQSPVDINKAQREYWAGQQAAPSRAQ